MDRSCKDAIQKELLAAKAIAAKAQEENRQLTDEDQTAITAHIKAGQTLLAGAKTADGFRGQIDQLATDIGGEHLQGADVDDRPHHNLTRSRGVSLGKAFTGSAEYKAMLATAPDGRFGDQARVHSAPWAAKDLITGSNRVSGAGSLLVPDQLGLLDPFYQRPLTIRDLVTPGTTGTDTIEYVRLVSVTNNAAPVPEAVSAGPIGAGPPIVTAAQGGLKPESAMVFERDSTNVKTIATWMPATKRAISDVGQIMTLIDGFLLYALDEELEDQIMAGNGVGENLEGIASTSGIQTQAAPVGPETNLDTLRRARRKVRIGGRSVPTAYVIHPIDWENIELLKDDERRYYGAGPFAMTSPTLWGLPVVESEAVPEKTAYCANWKTAVLWDREQASIQVTDSHADFFIRNLVAILAEMRVGFAVLRPSAFVKVTLA